MLVALFITVLAGAGALDLASRDAPSTWPSLARIERAASAPSTPPLDGVEAEREGDPSTDENVAAAAGALGTPRPCPALGLSEARRLGHRVLRVRERTRAGPRAPPTPQR